MLLLHPGSVQPFPSVIMTTSCHVEKVERCGTCTEEMRNTYKIVVMKHFGKKPLRRLACAWEDIKMDLKETKLWTGFIFLRTRTSGGLL